MTDNILFEYMQRRFEVLNSALSKPLSPQQGLPFITISRQFGCPSRAIAEELSKQLPAEKEQNVPAPWRIINKEIIENAAHELDMQPEKLQYVFDAGNKSVMDEVISALSTRYYKSDRRIRKTIREVIENLSSQGKMIIVGRGGVAITNDFQGSLHVRLFAPERWRLKRVMKKFPELKEAEAYRKMRYIDKKRTDLINHFSGNKFDFNRFDLQLNCETYTVSQCVKIIVQGMKLKESKYLTAE